jgi:uncharacterized protein
MLQRDITDNLEEIVRLESFTDEEREFDLDKSCQWVEDLLAEIEENLDDDEKTPETRAMSVDLRIKRAKVPNFGEGLVIRGSFNGTFSLPCIKCLTPTPESVKGDFEAVYISDSFEKSEDFEENLNVWADGSTLEVYFHDRGKCNVKKIIHEFIYLNINPYPLHSKDCKGLCGVCGSDLNQVECGHN